MKKPPASRKATARKAPVRRPAKKPALVVSRKAGFSEIPSLPRAGERGPKPYDWRPLFLKAIRESIGVVTPACEAAGICIDTAYAERKTNPEFAEAWAKAVEAGVDDLELHAFSLAQGKARKGVYFNGERVGEEAVQFERTLHKALAKHRPEWGDRTEVTGKGGKPLIPESVRSFDLEAMSDEELNALRAKLDDLAAAAH